MDYDIPGQGKLTIKTIILDLNGTLSVGGSIPEGVHVRLEKLKEMGFNVLFFTGNTRNDADDLASDIIIPTINDALDLFIDPQRLIATLRK